VTNLSHPYSLPRHPHTIWPSPNFHTAPYSDLKKTVMQNRTTITTSRRIFLGFLESLDLLDFPTIFLTHRQFSTVKRTPRLSQAY
jgi:hypothetical protein